MRLILLFAAATLSQAGVLLDQSEFAGDPPSGWKRWSSRADTAPRAFVDRAPSRGGAGSLAINGNSNPAAHGGWERLTEGLSAGKWYRLTAYYRVENVAAENWQVVARLDWRQAGGEQRIGEPDYVSWAERDGAWTKLSLEAEAPAGTAAVMLQFYLSNAPQGTVWWDAIRFEEIAKPAERKVTIASVKLRPLSTFSAALSVSRFIETIEKRVPKNADVILLPEGITVVGTGQTYAEVAETIPGPTTTRLAELARSRRAYIAAGIYEREGRTLYNTSVLIDRAGQLVGKYRKVYLPREEVERGLTPGLSFPTFDTEFGRVGMMICYDVFFADPARALAQQGADLILMPIWGGDESLAKARAIENGVFLVASGYDHPTYIMDPLGERLSEAPADGTVAVATIDLSRRYRQQWLGDMRTRRLKEQRTDVLMPMPGLRQ